MRSRKMDGANSKVGIENTCLDSSILAKDEPTFASELPSSQGKEGNISDNIHTTQENGLLSQKIIPGPSTKVEFLSHSNHTPSE